MRSQGQIERLHCQRRRSIQRAKKRRHITTLAILLLLTFYAGTQVGKAGAVLEPGYKQEGGR